MDILREASPVERAHINENTALYFYYTLNDRYEIKSFEHALALVLRRHPLLRAAIQDTVFIEKEGITSSEYVTELEKLPNEGDQFSYALDSGSLFHLYISIKEDSSTDCLLIIHHAIGDVLSGIVLIEDIIKGLLAPQIPQSSLPLHSSIETFFPYHPTPDEIAEYSQSFHNLHAYPATCILPITNPETPFEQTKLCEKEVTIRKDIYEKIKRIAKAHNISRHAFLTSLLLHAIPETTKRKSACVGTSVDMKRRLLEGRSQKDLFSGPLTTTSFIDYNGEDPLWLTAEKYAGALAAKTHSPDLYREMYGLLDEKINLFLLGMAFHISDAGQVVFSSSSVQEVVSHLSFSIPTHLNCPYITAITYDNTITLRIGYPAPWFSEETISAFLHRMAYQLKHLE